MAVTLRVRADHGCRRLASVCPVQARRLSAFDAAFLGLDGPVSVGHVCLTAVLDKAVTTAQARLQVALRLPHVPPLRWRLHPSRVPGGRPWWVDDPDLDLEWHVTPGVVPPPGTEPALAAALVTLAEPALPRDRPLWRLHVLQGVRPRALGLRPRDPAAEPVSALVLQMHHSLVDGIGGRDLLAELLAPPLAPGVAGRIHADSLDPHPVGAGAGAGDPSLTDLAGQTLLDLARLARSTLRLETAAARTLTEALRSRREPSSARAAGQPPQRPATVPPPTPFNGSLTPARDVAFGSLPITASRAVRRRTGASVHDVILAAAAGGLRAWLRQHDALPATPLVALVPMASPTPGRADPGSARRGFRPGNHLALALTALPTHLADPLRRLQAAHAAMVEAKAQPWLPEAVVEDLAALGAPTFTPLLTQAAAHLRLADYAPLPFNLMISSIPPGPADLAVAGARVRATYPFPALADGLGLGLTLQSYADHLDLGVTCCPDRVADAAALVELVRAAYAQLCAVG